MMKFISKEPSYYLSLNIFFTECSLTYLMWNLAFIRTTRDKKANKSLYYKTK